MAGGNGHASKTGEQQREGGGEVSGYALVLLELDHVHGHGLDDALAAHDVATVVAYHVDHFL